MGNQLLYDFLQALHVRMLDVLDHLCFFDVVCAIGALYIVFKAIQVARRRLKTTALRGPSNPSVVWGIAKVLLTSPNEAGAQYEKWAEEYGGVYEVPSILGGRKVVLCDPKAVAHLYGKEPWTYILTPFLKAITEHVVGPGLLTAIGDCHRRQRRTLTPAFNNATIRNLTSVFYDSVYKAKGSWDNLIESNGGEYAIIEVQSWMNHISFDTIGIAGFAHDFGTLDGKLTSVTEIFEAFANSRRQTHSTLLILLAESFPWLLKLPTPHAKIIKKLNDAIGEISNALLSKFRQEKEAGTWGEREEKSILGLLIMAESQGGRHQLTREEVVSHAKLLLLAGYETISISLTRALIGLAKNPDVQTKLRAELLEFGADPTYDQLSNNLPYLDAVIHESLRMHAPVHEFTRIAAEDDAIPLSEPVMTRSGKLVDHVSVAKGTYLFVSAASVNRATTIWGADAKEFKPERWIGETGIPAGAKEVQGHRHLLTFIDGPRTCLGKWFAIAELKIVLCVLVKRFVFELRDGPETEIATAGSLLMRPKVAGEEGFAVPMRVRRFE